MFVISRYRGGANTVNYQTSLYACFSRVLKFPEDIYLLFVDTSPDILLISTDIYSALLINYVYVYYCANSYAKRRGHVC